MFININLSLLSKKLNIDILTCINVSVIITLMYLFVQHYIIIRNNISFIIL